MKEISVNDLIVGVKYNFLWGPNNLLLSGIFVEKNAIGIADFNNARDKFGNVANVDENGNEIGVATAGPFFILR